MASKSGINNAGVDGVWRNLTGGGFNAHKTGNYGQNQLTVQEPNGRMVYSVKVVGVTLKKVGPTIFTVPEPRNYDILAVALLDDSPEAIALNGGVIPTIDVRYFDERDINASSYCWPKYDGQLYHNSRSVCGLHNILNAKLGQLAKQIASNPPKTLSGRIARVEKVLGDPLALVQQEITFG